LAIRDRRLDRDLWLSRIADLLLDDDGAGSVRCFGKAVRDGIRQGRHKNRPSMATSHFYFGPSRATRFGRTGTDHDVPPCLQEIFTREDLRNLLKAYEARTALAGVRRRLGGSTPWKICEFRSPRRG